MKCSFDFDDTLSRVNVQLFAKHLINKGVEVWVVTSRLSDKRAKNESWNKDLKFVTDSLGIENVHYCNLQPKRKFFKENNFLFHLDDDIEEVQDINRNTNTKAVHFVPTIRMEALNECKKLLEL